MSDNIEIKLLREELRAYKAECDALRKEFEDFKKRSAYYSNGLSSLNKIICSDLNRLENLNEEAMDRLEVVEIRLYPDILKDLQKLHEIIGCTDTKNDNRMDRPRAIEANDDVYKPRDGSS